MSDELQRRLFKWFEGEPTTEVNAASLKEFLRGVEKIHNLNDLCTDDIVDAIRGQGYVTLATLGSMEFDDLQSCGVKRAHIKVVLTYMRRNQASKLEVRESYSETNATTGSGGDHTLMGMAFANAMEGAKDVPKLAAGSQAWPTVAQARDWIQHHIDRAEKVAPLLANDLRGMKGDPVGHDLIEPLGNDVDVVDKAYYPKVRASLTQDQIDDFGDGEQGSALKLIKSVMLGIVKIRQEKFTALLAAFNAQEATVSAAAVKSRFELFKKALLEIRYHPLFELDSALKKLCGVIQPEQFLVHEVISRWTSSSKDQSALTAILAHVRKEIDVIQPTSNPRANSTQANPSRGGKGSSRSKNQQGRFEDGQSREEECRGFLKYGTCSYGDRCRFKHVAGSKAVSIHQVVATQMAKSMKEIRKDITQYTQQKDDVRREVRAELELERQRENARDVNMFQALMLEDSNQGVMINAVGLRTPIQVRQAPSEKMRTATAAKEARLRSSCKLPRGPCIDGAAEIDVCCPADVRYADAVFSIPPVSYATVAGSGLSNQGVSMSTPLVPISEMVVVSGAQNSLVTHQTLHDAGFSILYEPEGAAKAVIDFSAQLPTQGLFKILPRIKCPKKVRLRRAFDLLCVYYLLL
jgi:hypothetical protein